MAKKKGVQGNNLLEVQNAAKTLFANIRFQSVDTPIKSIMLTSTVPNEGKTVTSMFLAQAIATSGNRVLLVEGDMRRRTLANTLGVHSTSGLYSVLIGETPLSQAVVDTATPRLQFLDVEPSIPNPADMLASKRMGELVKHLANVYDYVVYDTPPVGTFVDAAVLARQVDGTILVVRPNMAKRSELQNAYEQLTTAGAHVLGICETFTQNKGSEYYYYYYSRDGKGKKSKRQSTNLAMPASLSGSSAQEKSGAAAGSESSKSAPAKGRGARQVGKGAGAERTSTPLPAGRGSRSAGKSVGAHSNTAGNADGSSSGSN